MLVCVCVIVCVCVLVNLYFVQDPLVAPAADAPSDMGAPSAAEDITYCMHWEVGL